MSAKERSAAPLSCLKWGEDGELSAHDTEMMVNLLAACEKSRRGFKTHFERRLRRVPISQVSLMHRGDLGIS